MPRPRQEQKGELERAVLGHSLRLYQGVLSAEERQFKPRANHSSLFFLNNSLECERLQML